MSTTDVRATREEAEPTGYVAPYVRCCYGGDGDEPGDCDVAVYEHGGRYWLEDGDDTGRYDSPGEPDGYPSLELAIAAARECAGELHEAEPGENAEDMVERLRGEAKARASADGEWIVGWVDGSAQPEAGRRYGDRADADAEITAWYDGVLQRTPTALVHMMRHPVLCRAQDGMVICVLEAAS